MADLKLFVDEARPQTDHPGSSSPDSFQFPRHLAARRVSRSGTWHAEDSPIAYRIVDGVATPVDPLIADVERVLERAERQFLQLREMMEESAGEGTDPTPPRAA